jgi:hypothetical protein
MHLRCRAISPEKISKISTAKTDVPQVVLSKPTDVGYIGVHGVWGVEALKNIVKSLLELYHFSVYSSVSVLFATN